MRFKGLDLNLFVAFEALMESRNTARAGERIGISQPAASAALARLRDYFGDPLLVKVGRRLHPTPFAESLLPRVRACLQEARGAVATSAAFDPATADRTFRIIASDYAVATLLASFARTIDPSSGNLRFHYILPDERAAQHLRRGEVDLLITPRDFAVPGMPAEPLYTERYVIAGWSGNPIFARPLSEEDVFSCGHVAVSVGSDQIATVGDRQLELMGRSRRVEVVASSFAVLPWLLIETDRLALMHERLAREAAAHFAITWRVLPFDFPVLEELVQYHETHSADPSLRWLIDSLVAHANALQAT